MGNFSSDLGFNPFDKNNSPSVAVDFFQSFRQQHIFCYNGNPRKKISSMAHTSMFQDVLEANQKGSDAYFYINGGRKQYAINQIAACFCDMDAGRDDEGKYFKPSVVMKHKERFLEKINSFPVPPSWVVDTRNGYQCYWILTAEDRNVNKTTWKGVQKKLANHFGGDPLAIKINQIYRVPYTWWRKGWEGKAPYFTSILPGSDGHTVGFNDLKNALDGTSANIDYRNLSKSSNAWFDAWKVVADEAASNGTPVENMSWGERRELHRKVADIVFEAKETCGNKGFLGMSCNPVEVKTPSYDVESAIRNYKEPNNNESIIDHARAVMGSVSQDRADEMVQRTVGEPQPVAPAAVDPDSLPSVDLNADTQQTFLLKKTVEFLNQVSTPLWFSKNHFLSRAARELADEISDKFCIG
jgi:hypothetical protein